MAPVVENVPKGGSDKLKTEEGEAEEMEQPEVERRRKLLGIRFNNRFRC